MKKTILAISLMALLQASGGFAAELLGGVLSCEYQGSKNTVVDIYLNEKAMEAYVAQKPGTFPNSGGYALKNSKERAGGVVYGLSVTLDKQGFKSMTGTVKVDGKSVAQSLAWSKDNAGEVTLQDGESEKILNCSNFGSH